MATPSGSAGHTSTGTSGAQSSNTLANLLSTVLGTSTSDTSGTTSGTTSGSTSGTSAQTAAGTTSQTTAGTSDVTTAQNVSGTQAGTTANSLNFDVAAKSALDAALSDTVYNKSAATADAKAASDNAMTQILQKTLPGITSASKAAGGYNDTTQQAQVNDLTARTAAAGSQVILDNIAKYASIQQGGVQATTGAVSATTGTTASTRVATGQTSVGTSGTVNASTVAGTSRDTTSGTTKGTTSGSTAGTTSGTAAGTTGQTTNTAGSTSVLGATSGNEQKTGASAGTVICTQLYRDGFVSQREYDLDVRFATECVSYEVTNGYRLWAVPFVLAMRKYPIVYALGKFVGLRWSRTAASYYSKAYKPSLLIVAGALVCVPICWLLGSLVPDVRYYKLWEGS